MASGRGVSMRRPGGGPNLRGVGGVVVKGNMVHALRVLMLRQSLLFLPWANCERVASKWI